MSTLTPDVSFYLRKRCLGVTGSCYYRRARVGSRRQSLVTVKSKKFGGSGRSSAVRMAFWPAVVAELAVSLFELAPGSRHNGARSD